MKNMRLKPKLLTGFLIIAFLAAIVGGFGIYGLLTTTQSINRVNRIGDNGTEAARLQSNLLNQRSTYRGAALRKSMDMQAEAKEEADLLAQQHTQYLELYSDLEITLVTPRGRELLEAIATPYSLYVTKRDAFVARINEDVDMSELVVDLEDLAAAILPAIDAVEDLMEYTQAITDDETEDSARIAYILAGILIAIMLVAVASAVIIGITTARSIAVPTGILVAAADQLSTGDVNVSININSRDEIGELAEAFRKMSQGIREQAQTLNNVAQGDYTVSIPVRSRDDIMNKAINQMVDSNNRMVSDIKNSAIQVSAGSQQIAQAAQNLATGSSEQAATIEEFTAAIAEIQEKADQNSKIATETLQEVNEVGRLMDDCNASMEQMLTAMSSIDDSSQNISKVIKVIDDIAFQTNILALNAAVEAARAGQHGKGFAVVADEVRNLASKSAEAASETAALIERSTQNVAEGNHIVSKVNEGIQAVSVIAAHNAESVGRIDSASREQSAAMAEITVGIGQLSSVVQANSATAEETAASAEEMSAQSDVLNQHISGLKLRNDGPEEMAYELQGSQPPSPPREMMPSEPESGFALSSDRPGKY